MFRLDTKEKREAARAAQFNNLTSNGYKKTEYKNLIIFTNEKDLLLKSFWGTAAHHSDFYRYRNLEQLNAKVESLKQTADRREQWKKEQKEKNAGHQSSHAATAAAIRKELKGEFPFFKFSVTSESFAGGTAVRIDWDNGATVEQVEKITSKYQYGHFNGMEDIYESTNNRDDIPQVKYVTESRGLTDEIVNEVKAQLMNLRHYTEEQINDFRNNPEAEARTILYNTTIPANYKSIKVERTTENCGSITDLYFVKFETDEQPTETKQTTEPPKDGKIQIIDYSEKAFAVVGETKPIKDELKNLGGSFNPRLNCGAGWIFSKTKMEAVKAFLIKYKGGKQEAGETKETEQPEHPQTLKEEIRQTVDFFAKTDLSIYGEITPQTKQIAEVQAVEIPELRHEIYNSLEDISAAAKSGKVISLLNLSNLVNAR